MSRWPIAIPLLWACGDAAPAPVAPSPAPPARPTPAAPMGVDDCTPGGGTCVAVSSCSPDKGHLIGGHACGAAHLACCSVGESSCGGKESWTCCKDGEEARPVCKDGGLTCLAGFTTVQPGACAKAK